MAWRYDVFPSFCGKDVRRNFLSHFLKEFKRHGIEVFVDNEISRSKTIGDEIVRAIEDSTISIVVLSRHYASSRWCLDELLQILKCREVAGKTVMSIFYEVDPSDVRKQTGDISAAFEEACVGKTEEERRRWSRALTEVASIAGFHSQKWESEAEMIEKIAVHVMKELNSTQSRDFDGFVGMETHIRNMNPLLCMNSTEVRMIGIWGPAGIGKTTIARSLYDRISGNFQVRIFMENVRGSYRRTDIDDYSSKLRLQERLLSEISDQRDMRIQHLGVAQDRLKDKKVILVLDDVDELDQLNALANQTRWFGSGSRIIITTKDKQILRSHGIDHIYEVGFPSREEALQIFCQSAFRRNSHPPEDFLRIAAEIADLAGHLPLCLSVLGSSLQGKTVEEWNLSLPRLRTSLDGKIEKVLRIGYDGLHDKDKVIFLHVACLFSGEKASYITQFLENTDLDAGFGLKVLADKSLLHITLGNYVVMHHLLQQMGKEIVRRQSINEPGKRQFLMNAKEICDVFADNTGTGAVLGISLDLSEVKELYINEGAFEKMPSLLFLRFFNNLFSDKVRLHSARSLEYLPRKLRILHWDAYPMKSMPSRFRPEFLVELDMRNSKLQKPWEGPQLASLKWMDLSGSKNLEEILNLSNATNLEVLYLDHCESLVTLPSSICNLKSLTFLHMEGCLNLEAFPADVNLESLSYLDLKRCPRLRIFPEISRNVIKIFLRGTGIERVPASIMLWSCLNKLDMSDCQNLKTFPLVPTTVEVLELGLTRIEEVPSRVGNLSRLRSLRMRYCKDLKYVSPNISKLKRLEELDFSGCKNVVRFPTEIFQIFGLILRLHNINDKSFPTNLPRKDPTSPTALNMSSNDMKRTPKSIDSLLQLRCLILFNCRNLVSVPNLPDSLMYLMASGCGSLERIPNSFSSPEISLHLGNCLKLDKESREHIRRCKHALFPGGEVPECFTHQARGSTITIRNPLQTFSGFKPCLVLATEPRQKVWFLKGLSVFCRFRSKHDDLDIIFEWPKIHIYPLQADHIYILDTAFFVDSESTRGEMIFEFSSFSCSCSEIIECGVRLFESSISQDNGQISTMFSKAEEQRMKEYYDTGYWRLISRPVTVKYDEEPDNSNQLIDL